MLPPQFTIVSQQLPRRVLAYPCAITGTPVAVYRRTTALDAQLSGCIRNTKRHRLAPTDGSLAHFLVLTSSRSQPLFFSITHMISYYVDFVNRFSQKKMPSACAKSIFCMFNQNNFDQLRSHQNLRRVYRPHSYTSNFITAPKNQTE